MIDPRVGKFTASDIYKLLKSGRKKDELFGQVAMKYITSKFAELLIGETISDAQEMDSKSMAWGRLNEELAIAEYELRYGVKTHGHQEFIPWGDDAGCTPDGLVGDVGMIEVKCPFNPTEHATNLLLTTCQDFKEYHDEYYPQIQMQLLCSGRLWCDFVSFDPRVVREELKLKRIRIYPDEEMLLDMSNRITEAVKLRDDMLSKALLGEINPLMHDKAGRFINDKIQ